MDMTKKAVECLSCFIHEMNEWEVTQHPLLREGLESKQAKAKGELDAIFLKYCTVKDRKQGRQVSLSCGNPPEYDLKNQVISEVKESGRKVYIYTDQLNRFKNQYRYTLIFKGDECLIDKKEWLDEDEGVEKWRKDYL